MPLSGDAGNMDDDGQAFPFVHKIVFGMGHPDGPVINVCTYASYAAGDAGYCLGLRYRYTSEVRQGWSYTGWTCDPDGGVFTSVYDAYEAAYGWACRLAKAGRVYQISALPDVFGWDGVPF